MKPSGACPPPRERKPVDPLIGGLSCVLGIIAL
jgi:hypothetical protein